MKKLIILAVVIIIIVLVIRARKRKAAPEEPAKTPKVKLTKMRSPQLVSAGGFKTASKASAAPATKELMTLNKKPPIDPYLASWKESLVPRQDPFIANWAKPLNKPT